MTRIVNINNTNNYDVYIGRAGHGHDGTFGNPHNVGHCKLCGKIHDRIEAVEAFTQYFYDRIEKDEEFKRRVLSLKDKVLGCFCSHSPCHGEVIVEWLKYNT